MLKIMKILITAAMAIGAAPLTHANAQSEVPHGRIELDQTSLVAKAWKSDGSHLTSIKGKLTFGEQPVENAVLQADGQGRSIRTLADGSFEFLVDRSLIAYKPVNVISVREAKIAGKPIGSEQSGLILAASTAISVFYPIEVARVEPSAKDANQVKVHARFKIGTGDKLSFFQVDKYRIAGQVTDADGHPVKDAIVWMDREGGEGFAKSTPTERDGSYEMFYWPEEDEANLTVVVGTRRYALPAGKVFELPRNTSVDIRIRLPREGSVIDDKPPSLVCTTSKGAKYAGLLAGLDVPPGTPYSVTIPDSRGRFVVTVPKEAWGKQPRFYETVMTKFVAQDKALRAGDVLPVGFVQPGDHDPRLFVAAP